MHGFEGFESDRTSRSYCWGVTFRTVAGFTLAFLLAALFYEPHTTITLQPEEASISAEELETASAD